MTKPNAKDLDLAMYMAALVVAAAEDAAERITEEQRARLQTWYETYEAAPESLKLSMAKITEKDLMEHVLCKRGV
jgi:DNA-binding GntR family transcriptional regulator